MLTLSQMAERLNRSTKTFRKYVDLYSIPHIKLGRDMLFDEQKVITYLESLTEEQKRPAFKAVRRGALIEGKGRFAEALGL